MPKFKFPKITVSPHKGPRNAFDLSQRHMFTAPLGMLLPVLTLHANPGDHFDISATDFMRTMPLNSTAFVDCKGVYEFFFVPYSQIWHPFDQFITGQKDFSSSLFSKTFDRKIPMSIPTAKLKDLIDGVDSDEDKASAHRLFSLLGYGNYWDSNDGSLLSGVSIPDIDVNIFPFCAYNKIYQDFYRNTQYEQYSTGFSLDEYSTISSDVVADSLSSSKFCMPKFRNYGMDYLTNIRPSALFNGNIQSALAPVTYMQGQSVVGLTSEVGEASTGSQPDVDVVSAGYTDSHTDRVSVASLRAAFAFDKLLSIMGRAPKTYKDQMKAVYGVDVPTGRDGKCYFIGGFDSPFQFSDIDQTSASQDSSSPYRSALGSSVSKGVGSGQGHVKFDVREHGMIMCIYSIIPTNQYDDTRIDPFNVKHVRNDYYIPMYDHIGMQPLYAGFINNLRCYEQPHGVVVDGKFIDKGNKSMTEALGWQPRYSEYKTAIDINHGQFSKGGPLSYFTSCRARSATSIPDNRYKGIAYLREFTLYDFKISPNLFDSVFKVNYNGYETTDPFFGGCFFNITKVSNMDVQSLPYA